MVLRYVREADLYCIHRVGQIPLDRGMITTLVERWRPEAHTFHLSVGEATITLGDFAILTDLSVSGRAFTGPSPSHTKERIHRMFGVLPPDEAMMGSSVKATWMHNTFVHLPGLDAEDADVQRYARIYCWVLISGFLFVDKSGNDMQGIDLQLLDQDRDEIASYNWASVALAFLYRYLCRAASIKRGKPTSDIAGPLVILQHITFCTLLLSQRDDVKERTGNLFSSMLS